jgi:hypothetical protein
MVILMKNIDSLVTFMTIYYENEEACNIFSGENT